MFSQVGEVWTPKNYTETVDQMPNMERASHNMVDENHQETTSQDFLDAQSTSSKQQRNSEMIPEKIESLKVGKSGTLSRTKAKHDTSVKSVSTTQEKSSEGSDDTNNLIKDFIGTMKNIMEENTKEKSQLITTLKRMQNSISSLTTDDWVKSES
jgi:hypothetical protein